MQIFMHPFQLAALPYAAVKLCVHIDSLIDQGRMGEAHLKLIDPEFLAQSALQELDLVAVHIGNSEVTYFVFLSEAAPPLFWQYCRFHCYMNYRGSPLYSPIIRLLSLCVYPLLKPFYYSKFRVEILICQMGSLPSCCLSC